MFDTRIYGEEMELKQIIEKKIEIIKEAIEIVSSEKLKAFLKGELVAFESLLREIEKNGNKGKHSI